MIVSSATEPTPADDPTDSESGLTTEVSEDVKLTTYVQPNQTTCTHPGAGWLDGGVPGRKYEWSCDVCDGKVRPLTLAEISRWQQQLGKMMTRLSEVDDNPSRWDSPAIAKIRVREVSHVLDVIKRAIRAEGKK